MAKKYTKAEREVQRLLLEILHQVPLKDGYEIREYTGFYAGDAELYNHNCSASEAQFQLVGDTIFVLHKTATIFVKLHDPQFLGKLHTAFLVACYEYHKSDRGVYICTT